ncbi:MAG TPA: threonine/serine dehydratase, partial [Candidatus Dormibacteraeota bacterium]|nr:threonine/serine dehydratase [Candidatus Dormibacteraeota bacterium]
AEAPVRLADIDRARAVVRRYLSVPTPLEPAPLLSKELGAEVWLKLETVQPTRAYKVRGALAKLASLDRDRLARGVVAASAGNHGQAVAWAAWRLGTTATIVMPRGVDRGVVERCRAYGADVRLVGDVYDDTLALAHELEERDGRTFVHPYGDPIVVAGQGTIGLEILEQLPAAQVVLAGVGGGGLVSGIATALKASGWRGNVYGVEPEGADAVTRSLAAGRPVTVDHPASLADKLVAKSTLPITLDIFDRYVDGVVRVSETAIADAVYEYASRLSLLVEGSGAVGLAALRSGLVDARERHVVLVVSGANISADVLARIVTERRRAS